MKFYSLRSCVFEFYQYHHKDEVSKAMLTILDGLDELQKKTAGPYPR